MDYKNVFAFNLKKQMDLHKKSRREISQTLGISYYTVSDWVNGKKMPRMDKVELLADYFGILKSDLIEEEEKPTQPDGLSERKQAFIERVKQMSDLELDRLDQILRLVEDKQ